MIGETVGFELADGEVVWVRENVLPIFRAGEREAISAVVSFTDIGPVREAQQQLRYLATRDALTGLYNRTFLAERMQAMLGRATCAAKPALLFVDLDGFRKVNDTGGHEAGDALLRDVGHRLAGCVSEADTLARVGGDEFVIAVCCYEKVDDLSALAQRVLDVIAAPFGVAGNEYYLGASIGISLYPDDGRSAAALMRNADSAMYAARQRGANQFQFFTNELRQRLQRRFQIERGLRRALASGELRLAFQPIVDGESGRVIGAEALLRWESDELGAVSPVEFIPVAEDTGMTIPIGQWVLEHACRQAAQWRRLLAPDFVMAVNFSPRQIADGLVEQVAGCLARTGLAPEALEVEITEGILMRDCQSVQPVLRALSDIGGAHFGGRLRHRLFVAFVPEALPAAPSEGRSHVRGGPARQPRLGGDHAGRRGDGALARHTRDGRGRGDARAGVASALARLRAAAGLPVRQAGERQGMRGAAARARRQPPAGGYVRVA